MRFRWTDGQTRLRRFAERPGSRRCSGRTSEGCALAGVGCSRQLPLSCILESAGSSKRTATLTGQLVVLHASTALNRSYRFCQWPVRRNRYRMSQLPVDQAHYALLYCLERCGYPGIIEDSRAPRGGRTLEATSSLDRQRMRDGPGGADCVQTRTVGSVGAWRGNPPGLPNVLCLLGTIRSVVGRAAIGSMDSPTGNGRQ